MYMTPERWQRIKEVFESALQVEPAQRRAFISNACRVDESLRQQVESLIDSHERTGTFIDSPAYQAAAKFLVDSTIENRRTSWLCKARLHATYRKSCACA